MRTTAALVLAAITCSTAFAEDNPSMAAYSKFWRDSSYCRQECINLAKADRGVIRAKVDGKWQEFKVRTLSDKFIKWNLDKRLESLEGMKKEQMPNFAGPHSGMVASRGFKRNDSQFQINNAVKGMGFLPTAEALPVLLAELEATKDSSDGYKLDWLTKLYSQRRDLLDYTKQASLELYATPEFATHTFLNQMADPGVSIVFLDMPSYEVRAIAQLLHPRDPGLTPYQRQAVAYVNGIHDYFHGRAPRQSIVAIYHVIEVFDNSPGRAKGKRVVPPLP